MKIIAHRGYWISEAEKNTLAAFRRAWEHGYGIETDVRDYRGELVISHNISEPDALSLHDFLCEYSQKGGDTPLAINIKADGLQAKLKALLARHNMKNYFVFDMSVPEQVAYVKEGFQVYCRHSPFEVVPALYEECRGVWMDAFDSDWLTSEAIDKHLGGDKAVCVVSPELHKKDERAVWQLLSAYSGKDMQITLCTDFPEKAEEWSKK